MKIIRARITPRPGDMAWFGQRYDFNGLMVWTGGRWVFAVTEDY